MEYQDCYVAFLDILGFASLVESSVSEPVEVEWIVRLQQELSQFPSGRKGVTFRRDDGQRDPGFVNVQTRMFSDTIVVFMPTQENTLGQLLFVVRYLHDRLIRLNRPLRGAIARGPMAWNSNWDDGGVAQQQITFGPALNAAYFLERDVAKHPRVVVAAELAAEVLAARQNAWPLSTSKRQLSDFFLTDDDSGVTYLDLLDAEVLRPVGESLEELVGGTPGFTVKVKSDAQSQHPKILRAVEFVCRTAMEDPGLNEHVREKYEWFQKYAEASR